MSYWSMRKLVNVALLGLSILAIILLLALVDCSGERPQLEGLGFSDALVEVSL